MVGDTYELFEPDTIVPSQFFANQRTQAPSKRGEYRLLVAVLEDSWVSTLRIYAGALQQWGTRNCAVADAHHVESRHQNAGFTASGHRDGTHSRIESY